MGNAANSPQPPTMLERIAGLDVDAPANLPPSQPPAWLFSTDSRLKTMMMLQDLPNAQLVLDLIDSLYRRSEQLEALLKCATDAITVQQQLFSQQVETLKLTAHREMRRVVISCVDAWQRSVVEHCCCAPPLEVPSIVEASPRPITIPPVLTQSPSELVFRRRPNVTNSESQTQCYARDMGTQTNEEARQAAMSAHLDGIDPLSDDVIAEAWATNDSAGGAYAHASESVMREALLMKLSMGLRAPSIQVASPRSLKGVQWSSQRGASPQSDRLSTTSKMEPTARRSIGRSSVASRPPSTCDDSDQEGEVDAEGAASKYDALLCKAQDAWMQLWTFGKTTADSEAVCEDEHESSSLLDSDDDGAFPSDGAPDIVRHYIEQIETTWNGDIFSLGEASQQARGPWAHRMRELRRLGREMAGKLGEMERSHQALQTAFGSLDACHFTSELKSIEVVESAARNGIESDCLQELVNLQSWNAASHFQSMQNIERRYILLCNETFEARRLLLENVTKAW